MRRKKISTVFTNQTCWADVEGRMGTPHSSKTTAVYVTFPLAEALYLFFGKLWQRLGHCGIRSLWKMFIASGFFFFFFSVTCCNINPRDTFWMNSWGQWELLFQVLHNENSTDNMSSDIFPLWNSTGRLKTPRHTEDGKSWTDQSWCQRGSFVCD